MQPNTIYEVDGPSNGYVQVLCPPTGAFVAYVTVPGPEDYYVYIVNPDGDDIGYMYSYGYYGGDDGNAAMIICANGRWAISYMS